MICASGYKSLKSAVMASIKNSQVCFSNVMILSQLNSFQTFPQPNGRILWSCEHCDSSSSSCSRECREYLIRARSELGCCVHAFNATILDIDDRKEEFAYSLWSKCNVEPVTQECFTLPPTPVDPTCDEAAHLAARLESILLGNSMWKLYVLGFRVQEDVEMIAAIVELISMELTAHW